MSTTPSTENASAERFIGRVKWFNNKAGYGFITITDGPKSGTDVFVHHSTIETSSEQYVYLVQGEYVEFCLNSVTGGNHEFQAGNVRGVKGGKLMCETRRDFKIARTNYRASKPESEAQPQSQPVSVKPPTRSSSRSAHSRLPRSPPTQDGGKWNKVSKGGKKPSQK